MSIATNDGTAFCGTTVPSALICNRHSPGGFDPDEIAAVTKSAGGRNPSGSRNAAVPTVPPETRDPARVWSPEQVAQFLEYAEHDRLGLLYRIILLHGLRRGEALGLLRADLSKDRARVKVWQTVLHVAGRIVIDTPKTRAGERALSLDSGTAELLRGHLRQLKEERLAAGEAYQDHGLLFCREDGTPYSPDHVSKRFQRLAAEADLPPIRLHEARHTAATLALEAGIDRKIVSTRLGHSTVRITEDLYTHVRQAVEDQAAETVLRVLPDRAPKRAEKTGS